MKAKDLLEAYSRGLSSWGDAAQQTGIIEKVLYDLSVAVGFGFQDTVSQDRKSFDRDFRLAFWRASHKLLGAIRRAENYWSPPKYPHWKFFCRNKRAEGWTILTALEEFRSLLCSHQHKDPRLVGWLKRIDETWVFPACPVELTNPVWLEKREELLRLLCRANPQECPKVVPSVYGNDYPAQFGLIFLMTDGEPLDLAADYLLKYDKEFTTKMLKNYLKGD